MRIAAALSVALLLPSPGLASDDGESCFMRCPGPLSQGVLDSINQRNEADFEALISGGIYRIIPGQERWGEMSFADLVSEVDGCEVVVIGDLTMRTGGDIIWSCDHEKSSASPCNAPVKALGIDEDSRSPGKLFVMLGDTTYNHEGCNQFPSVESPN